MVWECRCKRIKIEIRFGETKNIARCVFMCVGWDMLFFSVHIGGCATYDSDWLLILYIKINIDLVLHCECKSLSCCTVLSFAVKFGHLMFSQVYEVSFDVVHGELKSDTCLFSPSCQSYFYVLCNSWFLFSVETWLTVGMAQMFSFVQSLSEKNNKKHQNKWYSAIFFMVI